MTQQAYLKLISSSQIWQKMDKKAQEAVIKATGKAKKSYIQIFSTYQELHDQNDQEFLKGLEQNYKNFLLGMQGFDLKKNKLLEATSKIEEESLTEAILHQL